MSGLLWADTAGFVIVDLDDDGEMYVSEQDVFHDPEIARLFAANPKVGAVYALVPLSLLGPS